MKWQTDVGYRNYIPARLQTNSLASYGILVVMAVVMALIVNLPTFTILNIGITILIYFLLLGILLVLIIAMVVYRMRRLTGSRTIHYEISKTSLIVTVGHDKAELPLAVLQIAKVGKGFVSLKRQGSWLNRIALLVDSPEQAASVALLLRKKMEGK